MHYISDALYWISYGLLVPVTLLLIYFFIRSLFLLGAFFGQMLQKRKCEVIIHNVVNSLNADSLTSIGDQLPNSKISLVSRYMRAVVSASESRAKVDFLEAQFEIEAEKDLELSKTLIKMGPMLGLMGTLIPMGPALVGLTAGDMETMAYNMQIAFATTVVGLFSAAIGFVTKQIKQRWVNQDINNLQFLYDLIAETNEKQK